MAEYVVNGAEPNETVLHSRTPNGYEAWHWLPVRERIVRCRDCKHFTANEEFWIKPSQVPFPMIGATSDSCDFWAGTKCKVEPDGFCAWGERKEVDA